MIFKTNITKFQQIKKLENLTIMLTDKIIFIISPITPIKKYHTRIRYTTRVEV